MMRSKICEKFELVIQLDYHFGGYAKVNEELIQFMNDLNVTTIFS